jgi:hypothetical protein
MKGYVLSLLAVSSIAAIAGSQSAHAAATELCAGPTLVSGLLPGGPIKNGSSCSLEATGPSVSEIFIGKDANDSDTLKLGATSIFNNQTTNPGTPASQSVTPGGTLNFNLNVAGDFFGPANYSTGTAYTNTTFPFVSDGLTGVYHFAFFDVTSAADVNALFGRTYIPTGSAFDASFGNYSSWVFVGVEDSPATSSDDWNDTIYAFQNVAPVGTTIGGSPTAAPEPSTWVMMIIGFAGLGFAGYRASRKSAVVA